MRILAGFILIVGLAGCMAPAPPQSPMSNAAADPDARPSAQRAAKQFVDVVETVEPVAERECRARLPRANCDFLIVVDDRPGQPPNAFQTLDKNGRPVLAFTLALIADVRNIDEMAFVMSHEAAHHIAGHLPRQQQNAAAGAMIFAGLAALTGADASGVRTAQDLGAAVGARSYSKEFELEADALGTVIARKAGYDPVRGAEFFARIPDPGNRFLGTHPPNAARMETVRRVDSRL
ncbi:M48 family metallopeptidase [Aquicoccus sp.]|uniref:M48 family metallopeptidase n=1 Tax=Aquicoccus sp. TaxID=2055851 RepID=UPI003569B463